MAPEFRVVSERSSVTGWRYLWAKTVRGFMPSCHCARCLKGEYQNRFGLAAPVNRWVSLDVPEGTLLYFCGVANPYRWANNAHLAGRVTRGASASLDLYNGDQLEVRGLASIPIDPVPAAERFPHRGPEFLTCRNYQFGAQMFPDVGAA